MKKIKYLVAAVLLLAAMALVTGCAQTPTPYQLADGENYTVSIKFDANGGFFTTNSSVIVDSYNLDQVPSGANGLSRIALIAPDNAARGKDAFAPVKEDHFLAGWYRVRTEVTDEAGNVSYTYSGKWDFETDVLELDPNGSYTATEPQLTLYAAWVPMFQVAYCDAATGEPLETYQFDPTGNRDLRLPQWNQDTGAIEMYKFPERRGYTFESASYTQGGQVITAETLNHPGTVDMATATAKDPVLKVYVSYQEGQWYHIYNVEQFCKNATIASSLVLHADLDFAGKEWPAGLMHGKFTGTIEGNGHTISNVTMVQENNSKEFTGLFGRLESGSQLKDLKLENVKLTIARGTRKAGSGFGLLAGAIAQDAGVTGVSITGQILVDSAAHFGTDDYALGLVCGIGDPGTVDYSGITCGPTGEASQTMTVTVDGNTVTVTKE